MKFHHMGIPLITLDDLISVQLFIICLVVTPSLAVTCNSVTQARMVTTTPIFGGVVVVQGRYSSNVYNIGGSSCIGSYGLISTGIVTVNTSMNPYFWQYAMARSSKVYVCLGNVLCTLAMATGIRVTTEASKITLLASASAPNVPFTLTPAQPAIGSAFNITLWGTWTGVASFAFALGGNRATCASPLRTWNTSLGTAKILNTSAVMLSVDASATAGSVGSVFLALPFCVRMQTSVEIGAWFAVAHVGGHSNHNILLGSPSAVAGHTSANLAWSIPSAISQDFNTTRVYNAIGSTFDVVVLSSWITSRSFTVFAFDASVDMCNPNIAPSFTVADLLVLNSSHYVARHVTVSELPPHPGGGRTVLCGATNTTSPWVLLSYNWYVFRKCEFGTVYVPLMRSCMDCGPSPPMHSCNWHGLCGATNDAYESDSAYCVCNHGYSGIFCETRNTLTNSSSPSLSPSQSPSPSTSPTATPSTTPSSPSTSLTSSAQHNRHHIHPSPTRDSRSITFSAAAALSASPSQKTATRSRTRASASHTTAHGGLTTEAGQQSTSRTFTNVLIPTATSSQSCSVLIVDSMSGPISSAVILKSDSFSLLGSLVPSSLSNSLLRKTYSQTLPLKYSFSDPTHVTFSALRGKSFVSKSISSISLQSSIAGDVSLTFSAREQPRHQEVLHMRLVNQTNTFRGKPAGTIVCCVSKPRRLQLLLQVDPEKSSQNVEFVAVVLFIFVVSYVIVMFI